MGFQVFTRFTGKHVHLGVTGSVAAYKALDLLRLLQATGAGVGATLTAAGARFITPLTFEALGADPLYGEMFGSHESPYGHLSPGMACDVLAVAPATANTLARLACGLADDMLSAQALAFSGPLVLAPAMNPRMWEAPATRENWQRLKERGAICIEPDQGTVACGDEGQGRFPDVRTIAAHVVRAMSDQDLAGRHVLVTLGPTRERWDAVRFWSNPSTGTMGAALACAAWLRGAQVTAVCGPTDVWLPDAVKRIDVTSAREMFEASLDTWESAHIGCLCAAVADFSPKPYTGGKFKKQSAGNDGLVVQFEPNPDILRTLGQNKAKGQLLVGFAAEYQDLEQGARSKLAAKNLDLVVANPIGESGAGFASSTNKVLVIDSDGRLEKWPLLPKPEVAWRIWDLVSRR